jgi:hypothetical protein
MSFLGGKYQPAEQVIDGAIQTFRGRQLGTGRAVFLHRIPNPTSQAQASLLKLLLSSLYSSSVVKENVLDFGEEGDICYVVTQNLPQCLLLREWLQFEMDRCGAASAAVEQKNGEPTLYELASRPAPGEIVPATGAAKEPENRGDFTRLFYGEPLSKPQAAPVRAITLVSPESALAKDTPNPPAAPSTAPKPETARDESGGQRQGEFTKLFQASAAEPAPTKRPDDEDTPPIVASSDAGPGEFTRFFENADLPLPHQRSRDVAPSVQRPAHASTPLSERPGEFTRMFSAVTPAETGTSSSANDSGGYSLGFGDLRQAPNPSGRGAESSGALLDSGQIPASLAQGVAKNSPSPGPSEFTRVIGGAPPKMEQAQSAQGAQASTPPTEPRHSSLRGKTVLIFVLLAVLAVAVLLIVLVVFRS